MDFFEKLNNLLTEAGKEAEQRVKEVSDSMRLNSTIREEKTERIHGAGRASVL